MKVTIGKKEYDVSLATTKEEKEKGLMNVEELPKDKGMLFDFSNNPGTISMWMKNTSIPLDIIFIDEDLEVISVLEGVPYNEELITEDNVAYVLELNKGSNVKKGDELDFNEDSIPVMKVLALDGTTQMELWGGERIVSRRETKILIKKAKKADLTKEDSDYKTLGRYIFKVIKGQDTRKPEYVEAPK